MKIVITGYFPETAKRKIRESIPEEWELAIVSPEAVTEELGTAEVLIPEHVEVNAALLEKAPQLKLVQTGAGYDNVSLEDCTRYGVQVCSAAGVNAAAVAEHVMAFILCHYKNLIRLDRFMKAHEPRETPDYAGAELSEKVIGIVGMGNVGRTVAAYSRAFGMRVLGCGRKGAELPGVEMRSLEELCRESDIVSLHVPLTAETRHMINADVFRIMKKNALLINTARGAVVDEAALIRALQDGEIGGACLDVYEDEPLSAESPLRDLEQVILTPHTAGYPDGVQFHKKRYAFFVSNIRKVLGSETPACRLN
jgi:D-3-phosphoglycerate dehydrogenase